MKSIIRLAAFAALSIFVYASCLKDPSSREDTGGDNNIKVRVSGVSAQRTKAGANQTDETETSRKTIPLEGDSKGFSLVEVTRENLFTDEPRTKGANSSGSNFAGVYDEFRMDCYLADTNIELEPRAAAAISDGVYFSKQKVESDGDGGWALTSPKRWITGATLAFWSVAPYSTTDYSSASKDGFSLSWTLPSPDGSTDAVSQKDLVISCASMKYTSGSATLELDFYHALSAITFDVSGVSDSVTITKITLCNIVSSGACAVSKSSGRPQFSWTPGSVKKTYGQSYSAADFNTSDILKSTSAKHFMMIPQTLGSDASITVSFTRKGCPGTTYSLSAKINGHTWEAGKIHTYKLTNADIDLGVSVTDSVSGANRNTKSNLAMTNTARHDCYMRSMVIGIWYDSDDKIVRPMTDEEWTAGVSGLNVGDASDKAWKKGADGYYYHKEPVDAGEEATDLFASFSAPSAPATGYYLKVYVAAQVTPWDENKVYAKAAWGDTAAGYFN